MRNITTFRETSYKSNKNPAYALNDDIGNILLWIDGRVSCGNVMIDGNIDSYLEHFSDEIVSDWYSKVDSYVQPREYNPEKSVMTLDEQLHGVQYGIVIDDQWLKIKEITDAESYSAYQDREGNNIVVLTENDSPYMFMKTA